MQKQKLVRKEFNNAFKKAFPLTIPVLTGYLFLGITFGILMSTKGLSVGWSTLMSAFCFCGSMQFVAIPLMAGAFNPLQVFIISIMVNARHLFYGLAILGKYKGLGKIRALLIFWLSDETFSIVSSVEVPKGTDKKYFYFIISVLDYFYWIAGTFLGGVFGSFISFNTTGLDFVLTALFVVLFVEQCKAKENIIPAVIGVVCSAVMLMIFGADNFVIPAMIFILISLSVGRKKICK